MQFIKNHYKLFIVITAFWFLLTLNFQIVNVVIGLLISLFVTIFSRPVLYDNNQFLFKGLKVWKLVQYLIILFIEIFKSAFSYVINLLLHHYQPVVFEMKFDFDDPVLIGIIANSITLTPGTISIETSKNTITVLTLAKPGTPQEELERPIRDKFEKYLR